MKLNLEQNKRRCSVFVTIEQLREDLRSVASDIVKDTADDVIFERGTDENAKRRCLELTAHWLHFNDWSTKEIINTWCEIQSIKFFEQHNHVDDVLIIKSADSEGNILDVEWIASR